MRTGSYTLKQRATYFLQRQVTTGTMCAKAAE